MPVTRKRNIVGLFYSFPADLIQKWCLVSKQTATHYKSGRRIPSKRVMRLFQLHAQKRVLGDAWRGWHIEGDKLIPPNGRAFTQAQLMAYELVWQLASVRDSDEVYALLEKLANE